MCVLFTACTFIFFRWVASLGKSPCATLNDRLTLRCIISRYRNQKIAHSCSKGYSYVSSTLTPLNPNITNRDLHLIYFLHEINTEIGHSTHSEIF